METFLSMDMWMRIWVPLNFLWASHPPALSYFPRLLGDILHEG
jgi:hypothetical protein